MNIIQVASEATPYAKTGGLADVVGSLADELALLGHEVSLFIPRYGKINIEENGLEKVGNPFKVQIGVHEAEGTLYKKTMRSGVTAYFVNCAEYFDRSELYGNMEGDYVDNDKRFIFFQRAVLDACEILGISPDVVHCHDWQTGLIPVYLKTLYSKRKSFKKTRSIFTIHNLAYQGTFPPDSLPLTGLGWELYRYEMLEFYGKFSFIKGGLVFSDAITAVSEKYSREIQTKQFGCGLEGVLCERRDRLFGIVNGINADDWDPTKDAELFSNFDKDDLAGKTLCKTALQKEDELEVDESKPLFTFVSRLVGQKGLDILIPAFEQLSKLGIQLCILGTGDETYHKTLRDLAKKNKDWLRVHIVFDPDMAKRMYSASDFFLMPSYYEPCGLGQMIALRYGTIPIVRATGGLADTIFDFNPVSGVGNGFVFKDYSVSALVDAVKSALKIYKKKEEWDALVQNAFASDYSWQASAKQYVQLYENITPCEIKMESN